MLFLLLCLSILKTLHSARILCIFPTPFYSHQSVFQPIWKELSLRNHEVTVITTNPLKDASLSNLKEIDLSFSYDLVYKRHKMEEVFSQETNLLVFMKHVFYIMNNMTKEHLQHPQVQSLINENRTFDLMIVENHVLAWFGFAKKYNCPVIAITSMAATNFFRHVMGNLNNPVYTHSFNLPFGDEVTFFQRVVCVIFEVFDRLQNYFLLLKQQSIIRDVLQDPTIDIYGILTNTSLLITNELPGFNKISTSIPSIIQINGLQVKPLKQLHRDFKNFIDDAPHGIIYFSLGSNVKSSLMSIEKQRLFLEIFQELPYHVIWKFEEAIPMHSSYLNVKMVKWAPQQDILRHNKTKLFITQGGLQSIDESIRSRVPMLVLPFYGDQFYNALRVKSLGIGSWLDFTKITKNLIKREILACIDNKTIYKNLDELGDLLLQPSAGLNKAIWWIEFVLRHRGIHPLRSPLADMPFYQYYLFDVVCLYLGVFTFVIFFFLVLIKMLKRKIVRKFKAE